MAQSYQNIKVQGIPIELPRLDPHKDSIVLLLQETAHRNRLCPYILIFFLCRYSSQTNLYNHFTLTLHACLVHVLSIIHNGWIDCIDILFLCKASFLACVKLNWILCMMQHIVHKKSLEVKDILFIQFQVLEQQKN